MSREAETEILERIGIAIDSGLLRRFDGLIQQRGYSNRSEAIRDLIRAELVSEAAQAPTNIVAATVTLLYDHHVRLLTEKLTALQHEFHGTVISTMHVHLDHQNCLEVLVLRGQSADVHRIANLMIAAKGVKHGRLVVAATEEQF
ncbi:MAG: nickel-responsive transcriptional regulator NikR [Bryobacterales bacterium]|nr:nickel-responsive transcriptional regulator NikR [Bryobacterales bacterium]